MKDIKTLIGPLFGGCIFACGLIISGMTDPQKVSGFLDLFGNWDPTLMFVMGGALVTHIITNRFIKKRQTPLFDIQFHLPTRKDIDPKLIIGAIFFGIGWGITGLCPGPAISSLATAKSYIFYFFVGLIPGMYLVKTIAKLKK
jgi:hypothetical protein